MTMHLSRAFVLSSADYRETSRLVQMFCQNEGRISLIAKGIRSAKSPKAQLLDGFNLLQVKYNLKDGETLGLLTGLEVEKVFGSIRADLSAYARASYWFEIIKIAAQGRLASPAIFATTEKFLTAFEHDAKGVSPDQATSESMFTGFLITLCEQLGFGLHLHN